MTAGKILVVDDQPANLRVVGILLERQNYEVIGASSGTQALELALRHAPDLILLDMMMPGMDGFMLLAEIKQRHELLRVPVVFLTAAQDRDLLLRAFDAGAVDYVTKPFMPEELLARAQAHIGLKQARDRLERVARERQELVNLVAHDLKNPLSSVLFASDILLRDGVRPERVPRYLQMIHDSAQDALGYIRRYLETQSKPEPIATGQYARVSLNSVLDWLRDRYELQLEDRKMSLRVIPTDPDVFAAIDSRVLRQVAENLISNAMKYAPGGEITLTARSGALGFCQLLAEDRGPGIAKSLQQELFKPFVRLSTHDPLNGLSSGLGLSLAKQIVATAGGHLWYEDREGGGARFIVELPQALPAFKPANSAAAA